MVTAVFKLRLMVSAQLRDLIVLINDTPTSAARRFCREVGLGDDQLPVVLQKLVTLLKCMLKKQAFGSSLELKINQFLSKQKLKTAARDHELTQTTNTLSQNRHQISQITQRMSQRDLRANAPSPTQQLKLTAKIVKNNRARSQNRKPAQQPNVFNSNYASRHMSKSKIMRIEDMTKKAFALSQKVENSELKKVIFSLLNEVSGKNLSDKQQPLYKPQQVIKKLIQPQINGQGYIQRVRKQQFKINSESHQQIERAPKNKQGLTQLRSSLDSYLHTHFDQIETMQRAINKNERARQLKVTQPKSETIKPKIVQRQTLEKRLELAKQQLLQSNSLISDIRKRRSLQFRGQFEPKAEKAIMPVQNRSFQKEYRLTAQTGLKKLADCQQQQKLRVKSRNLQSNQLARSSKAVRQQSKEVSQAKTTLQDSIFPKKRKQIQFQLSGQEAVRMSTRRPKSEQGTRARVQQWQKYKQRLLEHNLQRQEYGLNPICS